MPKPINEKCARCYQLPRSVVRSEYTCWDEKRCDRRRSDYRRRAQQCHSQTVEIQSSDHPVAILSLYKMPGQNQPTHAIGAGLWQGRQCITQIQPIHTLGLTEQRLKQYGHEILDEFSARSKTRISLFKEIFEIAPERCPLCLSNQQLLLKERVESIIPQLQELRQEIDDEGIRHLLEATSTSLLNWVKLDKP